MVTAEFLKVALDNVGGGCLALEPPALVAWGIEKRAGRWLMRGVVALVWGGDDDKYGGSLNMNTNDRSDSWHGSIGVVTG